MSGRRLRKVIEESVKSSMGPNMVVVVAGLSNTYSSYVATEEEYSSQRYEGASTLYGPYTLAAYLALYKTLAEALVDPEHSPLPSGPSPPDFSHRLLSFMPPVITDTVPPFRHFGGIHTDVQRGHSYKPGETVTAIFHSGCPRNSLRTNGTFLTVERKRKVLADKSDHSSPVLSRLLSHVPQAYFNVVEDISFLDGNLLSTMGRKGKPPIEKSAIWDIIYDDNDWSTKFHWYRPGSLKELRSQSLAKVSW
eukprot:CAMPEP_0196596394 /NCGR_PEP_ID=MMETSP1081-20130531/85860_1 /TAXON_ID=36882 /ORGANISM="Pyramimonas amylifera, Strain CCMP720" /LENGTH=249 /DNA_ID=CAMNT_0041921377 /DNA_START=42 /DNA_END=788 /DNA_ORIENTATION=-